jgi:basic membrane protein A and related proteins
MHQVSTVYGRKLGGYDDKEGKYWVFGVDMDQYCLAPKLDKAVYDISVNTKENRTLMGKHVEYGFKENDVDYPEFTKKFVNQSEIKNVEYYKQQIINGKIKVPTSL